MLDVNAILDKIGIRLTEQLINDIQTKLIARKGASGSFSSEVNASGKLAKSITHKVSNGVLTIEGNDYIYYLENGRKPGKRPPIKVIRQWIDDKGITPKDISKDSLAYLIARRIGEEGSTIYQAGGSDLLSSIFNESLKESIAEEFFQMVASEITSEVLNIAA